jgi:glycosyltransferase 2 family protein
MTTRIRILVSAALLAWLAWRTDWMQIRQAAADWRPEFWLAAVVLYVLTQVISGLRWQILSRPLGFERSLGQYTAYYFVGMFFNLFLPTSVGGDVARAWYLDGGSGRRLPAFVSVIVDRLNGLAVLLALACVAVAFCPIVLQPWIVWSVWGTAGTGLLALFLMPLVLRQTRWFGWIRQLGEQARVYFSRPRLLLGATVLSLVVQSANVVLVWLVGQAIGAAVPASYYWIMVPMVTLLTLLPVSVNGMGFREGGTILFLTPLGVARDQALSLAILWFAVFTAVSLLGGAVYLFGRFTKPEVERGNHSDQQGSEFPMAA